MTSGSERWTQLQQVFEDALRVPGEQRAAFLDRACGSAVDLRAEVEAMLAADAPERALGIERMVNDADAWPLELEIDPFIGMRLGPWRVREMLGRGGMGTVYLAERADGQYVQCVALKLVHASGPHAPGLDRFRAERYILARLSHPNIARLLDAGFTPEGSAYLVMEYVDGSPVTTYCDDRRLSVEQRLRLFRVICDATQHAHQSLIVHRDLKPTNVFVSRAGEVKLLDFGIAKLLDADAGLDEPTAREQRALTPAYAAPEQLRGDPVTTAADVYALGVIAYELLTGQRPVETMKATDGNGGGPHVAGEPVAPSIAVRRALRPRTNSADSAGDRLADRAAEIAARRAATPARLARQLSGDLDRVVLKALRPEPERRYASAGQFAEDIDRLLDGRPVVAQPDTLRYRFTRFVSRNRVGVAVGAALFAVVTVFGAIAAMQARTAAIERDRARVEAARAQRGFTLVSDLFTLADPATGRGDTITARELLDRGVERIASEMAADPDGQAMLYIVVGRVYGSLALYDTAIGVLQRALALQRSRGGDTLAVADTLHALARQHFLKNDFASADRLYREALALRQRLKAPPLDLAASLVGFGGALSWRGKHAEAEAPLREALAIYRSLPGRPGETMGVLHEIGLTLHRKGDAAGAEPFFREAVAIGRTLPDASPAKLDSLINLGRLVHRFDRDPAAAEPIYREAVTVARKLHSSDHLDVAIAMTELARCVRDRGRLVEAEAIGRDSLAMFRRLYGTRHREVMISAQSLGGILHQLGKVTEAEVLYREAFGIAQSLLGEAHPLTLSAQRVLASLLESQKRFREAARLRESELAKATTTYGAHDVYVALALTGFGHHHLAAGRAGDAEGYFRRALDVRQHMHPPDHWRIGEARVFLGASLVRARRFREAEPLIVDGYTRMRDRLGAATPETKAARERLVELYDAWGRPDAARDYR